MGFELQNGFWRNLNLYTALALVITFMYLGGFLPNIPSPLKVTNPVLNIIIIIIYLIGAGASLLFIITRIVDFKN
ncbi:MAG: hypothetical protein AABY22_33490 [Nanoarchaeota archaeon]